MIKNIKIISILVLLIFTASCATQNQVQKPASPITISEIENDVYTGKDRIKFLADGIPDRIFFATNKSDITTRGSETLLKQVTYLKANPSFNIVLEGHADERGTREYNLALGEKRANAVRDFLMVNGIASDRIKVLSYGKERPANPASNPLAWSQNRRTVTVKVN